MNIVQKFFINASRITMLNLAGIVIGGIASAAQLFEEKELKTKKNTPDTIARRHTFRSV